MTQLSDDDEGSHISLNEGWDFDIDIGLAVEDSDGGIDSESEEMEDVRPFKKPKPVQELVEAIEITAYVEIVSPPRTLKAKPTSVTCGPFFFTLESSYPEFLQSVTVCASVGNSVSSNGAIDKGQLGWKLSVPANDRKKPLSDERGYRALLKKMKVLSDKKKDCTIVIMLPPLSKVARNVSFRRLQISFTTRLILLSTVTAYGPLSRNPQC
jgi:hypothetical protein